MKITDMIANIMLREANDCVYHYESIVIKTLLYAMGSAATYTA